MCREKVNVCLKGGRERGENEIDRDGIRTRAPYEIGALIQRLRPTRPPDHAIPSSEKKQSIYRLSISLYERRLHRLRLVCKPMRSIVRKYPAYIRYIRYLAGAVYGILGYFIPYIRRIYTEYGSRRSTNVWYFG